MGATLRDRETHVAKEKARNVENRGQRSKKDPVRTESQEDKHSWVWQKIPVAQLLGRLEQEEGFRSGIQSQPGQHSETP